MNEQSSANLQELLDVDMPINDLGEHQLANRFTIEGAASAIERIQMFEPFGRVKLGVDYNLVNGFDETRTAARDWVLSSA